LYGAAIVNRHARIGRTEIHADGVGHDRCFSR
jgi:hypothetical protein